MTGNQSSKSTASNKQVGGGRAQALPFSFVQNERPAGTRARCEFSAPGPRGVSGPRAGRSSSLPSTSSCPSTCSVSCSELVHLSSACHELEGSACARSLVHICLQGPRLFLRAMFMSDVLGMWHGEHKPTTREHVRCSVTRALPVAWVLCTYVSLGLVYIRALPVARGCSVARGLWA